MRLLSLTPIMITLFGGYFLIKLKFFFLIHPIKTCKKIISELKSGGSFRSLSLALAGTLGVGNILGTAFGIIVGGAGSVFWLAVSSFFASAIKYAECVTL